jgi:putative transposase
MDIASNPHHRRSIRLKGYDYSQQGLYFITLCVQNRVCLFGEIVNGEMTENAAGKTARQCWNDIPNHYPQVILHEFVVMPNHIHGIIQITDTPVVPHVGAKYLSPMNTTTPADNGALMDNNNGAFADNDDGVLMGNDIRAKNISPLPPPPPLPPSPPPRGTSQTVGAMVRGFKIGVTKWMRQHTDVVDVWQRNYWEHIIRTHDEYERIATYIENNPTNWNNDTLRQ